MAPTKARRREEQGRLFWLWLLTLPIILILAAAFAFGAPWPTPLTQRFAMAMLAFPVLFMVGDPLFRDAKRALTDRFTSLVFCPVTTVSGWKGPNFSRPRSPASRCRAI